MFLQNVSKEYKIANIILAALMIFFLLLPLASLCSEHLDHHPFFENAVTCFYKNHTGEPCPTCGLTHSILSLYKGRLQESVAYHSYGYFFFLLLIIELNLRIVPFIYKRLWIPYVDILQLVFCGLVFKIVIGWN